MNYKENTVSPNGQTKFSSDLSYLGDHNANCRIYGSISERCDKCVHFGVVWMFRAKKLFLLLYIIYTAKK
jgi:hypothetical protein